MAKRKKSDSMPAHMQIAHALRDELRERGEFRQDEFQQLLACKLEGSDFQQEMFQQAVAGIAAKIDNEATAPRKVDDRQLKLWDLEGDYALGESRRVGKARAHKHHFLESLSLAEANLEQVRLSLERRQEELDRLDPYWPVGITKAEAIARYRLANPNAESA